MYKQRGAKWTMREQIVLLRHLGNLLEKGYSLWHALEFLQLYTTKEKQEQLHRSVEQLKSGGSLHSVFAELHFHRDMLAYLFYAEQHGNIAFALKQGSSFLERKEKHYRKLLQVIRYPLFLLSFLSILIIVFNTVLFPQFASFHHTASAQPSAFANAVLLLIQLLPHVFATLLVFIGAAAVYYYVYFRKLSPVIQMKYIVKTPFLNSFFLSINSHYFAEQLSSLLQGGLSILESFLLMEQQEHQPFFQSEAKDIHRLLVSGETLEHILQKRPYYEQELFYVVTHGQAGGELAKELADYSGIVVEKLEERITKLMLVIQPVLFAAVGVIVVLLYLAILLPMFQTIGSM